ncbi:MAG TPA: hypothetical protein VGI43_05415, partial [Mucilaginibacter sp.]
MRIPAILIIIFCLYSQSNPQTSTHKIKAVKLIDTIPQSAKKLMECYKNYIIGFSDNSVIFKDKSKITWD